jgi:hypothetical protein
MSLYLPFLVRLCLAVCQRWWVWLAFGDGECVSACVCVSARARVSRQGFPIIQHQGARGCVRYAILIEIVVLNRSSICLFIYLLLLH